GHRLAPTGPPLSVAAREPGGRRWPRPVPPPPRRPAPASPPGAQARRSISRRPTSCRELLLPPLLRAGGLAPCGLAGGLLRADEPSRRQVRLRSRAGRRRAARARPSATGRLRRTLADARRAAQEGPRRHAARHARRQRDVRRARLRPALLDRPAHGRAARRYSRRVAPAGQPILPPDGAGRADGHHPALPPDADRPRLAVRERAAYLGVLTLRVRELTPLSRPLAWAGSGLMVIGFCLGLVTLATRSLRSDTVVVLCWIVGVVAGVTLWMPVAHYRYTLP